MHYLLAAAFLVYIVSGLIRLIEFNIKTDAGSVDKYFTGIPTPLGAILLWILYLIYSYALLSTSFFYLVMVLTIAVLMNSKVKIPHP
jgi:CDP-diacylglycerol--serine O-phosphatidyltransferase